MRTKRKRPAYHTSPQEPQTEAPREEQAQEQEASEPETAQQEAPKKVGRLSRINKRVLFFGTAVLVALVLFAIAFMDSFSSFADKVMDIISPLIIGGIIAYLCNPIFTFYEYKVFGRMKKGNARRGISLALTIITAFAIVALIVLMMVPELIKSIERLVDNSDTYISGFLGWVQGILDRFSVDIDISDTEKLESFLTNIFGSMENMYSKLLSLISKDDVAGSVMEVIMAIFNAFKNVIIGLFIAFYLLGSKEKRIAQVRKFRAAILTEKQDQKLSEFIQLTDDCFGGFIFGKILDSLVIGILTFVLMTIFDVSDYNLLISTFIGLTNVIPVFGPFIGAIPSAFIVLICNPSKFFLFIILILIIQQLDGNIIGPKILGDSTGVSSLCVIIAICTCGSIWGIPGMIIGVPIFAVVIEWIKRILEARLKEKNKPTDTLEYYPSDTVVNAEQDLYYEHSGLRYRYEHSKMKPRMERMQNNMFSHLGRQNKSGKGTRTAKKARRQKK